MPGATGGADAQRNVVFSVALRDRGGRVPEAVSVASLHDGHGWLDGL